jgi:predicted acetyltransferase
MLKEALLFVKPIGLSNVILIYDKGEFCICLCDKKCGGILDDEFYNQTFNEVIQRYIICS